MPRKTKDERHIDSLCRSFGFDPKGVYYFSRFLCEAARNGYSTIVEPVNIMTDEEIVVDKRLRRRELLHIMVENEKDSIAEQQAFVYKVLRTPWLWDRIQFLLDQVVINAPGDAGLMYKTILLKSYFSEFPETNCQLADLTNVSDSVIDYRKREAIKLFGIMIWQYCMEREKEDNINGLASEECS